MVGPPPPPFGKICAIFEEWMRLNSWVHEFGKPPGFKNTPTGFTAEEADRLAAEDLRRAYGPEAVAAREAEAAALAAAKEKQNQPQPPPPPSAPAQRPKCDVMAVPLVRNADGHLVCDWSQARPAGPLIYSRSN
jgi:hypothetical protein